MKPNHKQAVEDAFNSTSNLAMAHWEVLRIMAAMTHHDGALEEFRSQWEPIVQAYLSKFFEIPGDECAIPTGPLQICDMVLFRGGGDRLELKGVNGELFTMQIEDGKLGIVRSEDQ